MEDLLGPARPPRMPLDLTGKLNEQQEGVERGELGQKELICCVFDDWIDGKSIGHDPLIYIRAGGLILVEDIFKTSSSSFPHRKHTKNRFGI